MKRLARAAALTAAGAVFVAACSDSPDPDVLARGASVYATHCASCHGARLEGQPNWKTRLPDGTSSAPPHNDTGHTWHHSDRWLFHVVENGMVPPLVRPGYKSGMPAFGDQLSDAEIRAVLAYIKSHWSEETRRKRDELLANRQAKAREPWRAFRKLETR